MTDETKTIVPDRRVLRLFGADAPAVRQAVQALPPKWGLSFQCRSRGGETLVALQAKRPEMLEKGEHSLRACFPNDLYGTGGESLPHAVVQALEKHQRLLVCADAGTGALLETRLETVEGAERVFDFGALSYADPRTGPRIEEQALHRAGSAGALRQELERVRAAQKLVGAEFAAGCLTRERCVTLLLGTRKGFWLRSVLPEDNPALWLLDMVRRAACGLRQAEGTRWQKYRAKVAEETSPPPAAPSPPPETAAPAPDTTAVPSASQSTVLPRKKHRLRKVLFLLLLLLLAGLAGAWYYTGGNLAALPEVLGWESLPHVGATLL